MLINHMPAGGSPEHMADMLAFLRIAIPRAKLALAGRPSAAAWEAVHDAEKILQRRGMLRARGETRIEILRGLCRILIRYVQWP